jgi:BirA family biotin operon repressor/biotin-[acetyl-CoA-carboxylase] ligase
MSTASQKRANALLDADPIRAATFVRHVEIHDTLGSTNDRAAELARESNIDLPALVVARHQTAGRGRGRNTWWAADGALTFSLLIDPREIGIHAANWPQLSLATAVAVCDALTNETDAVRRPQFMFGIKWPNDVLLGGRKVCGILVESPGGSRPAKDRLVIGIGINVNNSWRAAPNDIASNGTALCDISGKEHDLPALLAAVIRAIGLQLRHLQARNPALPQAWKKLNSLARKRIVLEAGGRAVEGRCLTIADDGAIVLRTASGNQRFVSGSVRVL